jgi:hypothetical protein
MQGLDEVEVGTRDSGGLAEDHGKVVGVMDGCER